MESMLNSIKRAKSKSLTSYKNVHVHEAESMTRCDQEIISYSNHFLLRTSITMWSKQHTVPIVGRKKKRKKNKETDFSLPAVYWNGKNNEVVCTSRKLQLTTLERGVYSKKTQAKWELKTEHRWSCRCLADKNSFSSSAEEHRKHVKHWPHTGQTSICLYHWLLKKMDGTALQKWRQNIQRSFHSGCYKGGKAKLLHNN